MLRRGGHILVAGALLAATPEVAEAAAPEAFGVEGRAVVLTVEAKGDQVYACAADAEGKPVWTFRRPAAELTRDGMVVGRHYEGPTWELTSGGAVKGKAAMSAPGATPADVPLLKLDVVEHRGEGVLKEATTVLRLETHGGALSGACPTPGVMRSEPYTAEYVFLR